ncbi:WD repeat-containing protein 6 [Friedmanniomyces endolithicus]|nr:WD repeat-containing protein 6 [Friedmanniomyces endolithicus]KAK0872595.1 WD repeat-containing protein 6 [Friedmanniomyces endolithicus]KAK0917643.1 WD repeat-containing protein 6 [Friedmanniomyces endolithicus]
MLEHVHHQVPVTALAFSGNDLIFAGEGNLLNAYDIETSQHRASLQVFRRNRRQAIHGLIVDDTESPSIIIVWGGCLVRSLTWSLSGNDRVKLKPRPLFRTADWILDASLSAVAKEGGRKLLALVTAHNSLIVTDSVPLASRADSISDQDRLLVPLVPGSNCLLYCAHVTWRSPSHCLIACGTVFGDVIVWSVILSYTETGSLVAGTHIHYSFPAHDGSVFGVQISSMLPKEMPGGHQRVLATCSDDRTIRVWDLSNLATSSPVDPSKQCSRTTGYSTIIGTEQCAPRCLAKTMGHMSRIWHVRAVPSQVETAHSLQIVSFGEDASTISWHLEHLSTLSDASTHFLQQFHFANMHAGKHIWSTAISSSGRIATGGSDGTIAIRSLSSRTEISLPLKIGSLLLGSFNNADTFKAYSFIAASTLLATTTQGKLIALELLASQIPWVSELASSLPGLCGYSVVTSVPGAGWAAGLDGKVYMYVHEHRRLTQVFDARRKITGLFAQRTGRNGAINLLVTGVGDIDPTMLLLTPGMAENINLMPVLQKAVRLAVIQDFVVTSFVVITTEKCYQVVLGSRKGDAVLYDIDTAVDQSVIQAHPLLQAHGKEAITSLHWVGSNESPANSSGLLHSTGRDGTHAVHHIQLAKGEWHAELVHSLALPFGPNVEGLTIHTDNHIWIWGFRGKDFVAYDINAQREIIAIECGGAHRNWAFQPEGEGGWFVWTGKAELYQQQQTQLSHKLLNSGGHGREIKALAISSTGYQTIATGAEDTNIKLWAFSTRAQDGFRCLQTLRKHNTGIQHLQWSRDGRYLFSSGGFEEFFVWRVRPGLPGVGHGVVCESTNPNSGSSDLRIMGFEVREDYSPNEAERASFEVYMAYSDSTLKCWSYEVVGRTWSLQWQGDYLTACLTDVFSPFTTTNEQWLATAATDGHLALWSSKHTVPKAADELRYTHRHKIHQNAILSVATISLPHDFTLVITGGDDNAIGITRLTTAGHMHTLLIPRAHAAAVTGLAVLKSSSSDGSFTFASAGIDQRVKLWRVTVDAGFSDVYGIEAECVKSTFTAVADVASVASYKLADGKAGVLVAGVGMDVWEVKRSGVGRSAA